MRASDRVTGVGIRIPLCTCTLKAARRGRRPAVERSGTNALGVRRPVSARLLFRSVGADDPVRSVPLSLRRGRRPRHPVSARLLFCSVGADDPVRPVPLSFRASARTGVGIRIPLCTCTLKAARRAARPQTAVYPRRHFPVMQCTHLPFRRQQASSHPLTCHGMVPQASRTHFSGHDKTPRLSSRGFALALPIFPGRLQPSIVSRSELN